MAGRSIAGRRYVYADAYALVDGCRRLSDGVICRGVDVPNAVRAFRVVAGAVYYAGGSVRLALQATLILRVVPVELRGGDGLDGVAVQLQGDFDVGARSARRGGAQRIRHAVARVGHGIGRREGELGGADHLIDGGLGRADVLRALLYVAHDLQIALAEAEGGHGENGDEQQHDQADDERRATLAGS